MQIRLYLAMQCAHVHSLCKMQITELLYNVFLRVHRLLLSVGLTPVNIHRARI